MKQLMARADRSDERKAEKPERSNALQPQKKGSTESMPIQKTQEEMDAEKLAADE